MKYAIKDAASEMFWSQEMTTNSKDAMVFDDHETAEKMVAAATRTTHELQVIPHPAWNSADGKQWATLSALHAGDVVQVAGGFACMTTGDRLTVKSDGGGDTHHEDLYVECAQGRHYLWVQSHEKCDAVVGFYRVKTPAP